MTKSEVQRTRKDYDRFWGNSDTALIREEAGGERVYNLEERTARFGKAVIDFAKTIPQNSVTYRLVNQVVGAGTSVGANYVEADAAISKKKFLKSIGTCKKESREVRHFLRMAVRAVAELKPEARKLWRTASDFPKDLEERQKCAAKSQ